MSGVNYCLCFIYLFCGRKAYNRPLKLYEKFLIGVTAAENSLFPVTLTKVSVLKKFYTKTTKLKLCIEWAQDTTTRNTLYNRWNYTHYISSMILLVAICAAG